MNLDVNTVGPSDGPWADSSFRDGGPAAGGPLEVDEAFAIRGSTPADEIGRRDGDGKLILSWEQGRSLWLHRAILGRLVLDPEETVETARKNLPALQAAHPRGGAAYWLHEWELLLAGETDAVVWVLMDEIAMISERGCELRQNSPFANVLMVDELRVLLDEYRANSRR